MNHARSTIAATLAVSLAASPLARLFRARLLPHSIAHGVGRAASVGTAGRALRPVLTLHSKQVY